jgi:hypothetical protein
MARYVMVSVPCPCNKHIIATRRSDADSTCEKNGTTTCPKCKRRVRWSISEGRGRADYVN